VFVVLSVVVSSLSLHASNIKQKAGSKAKIFFIQKHLIKNLFPYWCIGNRATSRQKNKIILHIIYYWHDFLMLIIVSFFGVFD
jgi:hypothetical protein